MVHMTAENAGDAEQMFFAEHQKILWDDKETRGETPTRNGTSAEDLNPGVVLDATAMFGLADGFPNGGAGSALELPDSGVSSGVDVRL